MSKLTVSINADNEVFPATQFTSFDYAGICSFNGELVMCGTSGVFEYVGNVDGSADVDAWFEIAATDFGILNQKRLRAVLGSGIFSGDMVLSVSFDDGSFTDYSISEDQSFVESTFKRFIHREQKGAHVIVKVSNVDGADFSIDALDAIVMLLHNKPSGLGYIGSSLVHVAGVVGELVAEFEIS